MTYVEFQGSEYGIAEFQRGRSVERERIVDWLRLRAPSNASDYTKELRAAMADAIERGEHFEEG